MDFGTAIKSFWTNYVNFKGRARRSEYWFIFLFLFLTNLATTLVDSALFGNDLDVVLETGGAGPVRIVWSLVVLLPSLAVVVRRLHDTGRSAWWLLIALVPVAGLIVLFVFAVFGSDPVANRYGPSHLEQESPEEF